MTKKTFSHFACWMIKIRDVQLRLVYTMVSPDVSYLAKNLFLMCA